MKKISASTKFASLDGYYLPAGEKVNTCIHTDSLICPNTSLSGHSVTNEALFWSAVSFCQSRLSDPFVVLYPQVAA